LGTSYQEGVMNRFLVASLVGCVVPGIMCFAQTAKPDGTKVLDQAREALSRVDAMSYEATVAGERGLEAPAVKARVSMAKAEAGGWRIYTKGTSGTNAFEVAYDGSEARSVRETDKVVYRKTPRDNSDLMVFFSGQNA
jgi:hypothetical protein